MKKFKIFSLIAVLIGGLFLLSGCGQKELTGSLEDIMKDLNESRQCILCARIL